MARHAMSSMDAAWLHMDGPAHPAVVNGLVLTAKPLDAEALGYVLRNRLLHFDRFRQRVVEPALGLGLPQWEDVEDIDLDDHLHLLALPHTPRSTAADRERALAHLVADIASQPLPRDRPLWQAHLIDRGRSGAAFMLRYHHCIGDGLAMMNVAGALFDPAAHSLRWGPPPPLAVAPPPSPLAIVFEALQHPQQGLHAAEQVMDGAQVLLHDLLIPPDPPSPMKGEFGVRQAVAWSSGVELSDVKDVAWPFHATVNDVLVACVAGALRRYLKHRGIDLRHRTLRAVVPVNLRPAEHRGQLSNEFGLSLLALPIEEDNPVQRVTLTQERMAQLKHSTEPVAMQWLCKLLGHGPKPLQDQVQALLGSKASVVLSNLAGPRQRLYLAGRAVDRLMFWVPHPGDTLGMGLSLLSYRGQITLGVMADAQLVPDPQWIADAFVHELEALIARYHSAVNRREHTEPGHSPAR